MSRGKYYTPMDTFDDVVEYYESTKPVRKRDPKLSKRCVYTDLRPTNTRERQLECVRKLTNNKYAICDYDTTWSYVWSAEYDVRNCENMEAFKLYVEKNAPILWERKRNGDEVMTVRNLYSLSHHTALPIGRVDFLDRHLPRMWQARSDRQGHQFIHNPLGLFVLPKNNFLQPQMREYKRFDDVIENTSSAERHKSNTRNSQMNEDKRLVFVRRDGNWLMPTKIYRELKWRIDTKRKKKLQPVRKFIKDNLPMIAMLNGNVSYVDNDVRALVAYMDAIVFKEPSEYQFPRTCLSALLGDGLSAGADKTRILEKEVIRIARLADHEHAVGLIKVLVTHVQSAQEANPEKENFRPILNDWVNRFFELKQKVEA